MQSSFKNKPHTQKKKKQQQKKKTKKKKQTNKQTKKKNTHTIECKVNITIQ